MAFNNPVIDADGVLVLDVKNERFAENEVRVTPFGVSLAAAVQYTYLLWRFTFSL